MHLYLLRHGEAGKRSDLQDHERPLTDHGSAQARSAGSVLLKVRAGIETVISSPLIRARQTAEIVCMSLGITGFEVSETLAPGADRRRLYAFLSSSSAATVLLVGHEPQMSETVSELISGRPQCEVAMGTCTLARVDVEHPVGPGRGTLRFLLPQDLIEELSR